MQRTGTDSLRKVGEGISFAIPAEYAADFLQKAKQLRHKQESKSSGFFGWGHQSGPKHEEETNHVPVPTRKKYLGLTMITLTPSLIESSRARDSHFPDVKSGVLIYRVVLGSPAHM